MRIYLTPNGLGLGHIRRSEAIASLLQRDGHQILYSTYLDGYDYARGRGYPSVEAVPLSYRVKNDGAVDYKATVAHSGLSLGVRKFLIQLLKEIRYIRRFKPNIVFSDSRLSPLIASRLLGIPVILLINQLKVEIVKRPSSGSVSPSSRLFFLVANIFWVFISRIIEWMWSQSDLILIPDYPPPYTICRQNLDIPTRYLGKIRLIGPILEVKPKVHPNSRKNKKSLKRPVIYAAVSGPRFERRILASHLKRLFQSLQGSFRFVMTEGEPKSSLTIRSKNIEVYSWVDEKTQYKLIDAADLIISRAGHGIITKSMAFGKKMILIPIPDHTEQWNNARTAERLGVAKVIRQEDLSLQTLTEAIRDMIRRDDSNLNDICEAFGRLDGAREAVAAIYSICES